MNTRRVPAPKREAEPAPLAAEPEIEEPAARRGATSTEMAYRALRQKIIDSELTPGSYLLEQQLVLMLGLSRTPIREALIRLQMEGLVQIVPRHGIRIVPTSLSDIKHIYEVLVSLESTAAGLIAAREDADLSTLEAACTQMTSALEQGDMKAWVAADEFFHAELVRLGGNARLAQVVMNCRDQVHRVRRFTQTVKPHPRPADSTAEHYAMIEAMRRGDAAAASALYREHRERGWREQLNVLEQFGIQQA
jgi:DNA-binding GntR family transcriptional regulator